MSKKLLSAILSVLLISILVLSFFLEPLHAIIEGFLLTTLLIILFVLVYHGIYELLTMNDPKRKKDNYYL